MVEVAVVPIASGPLVVMSELKKVVVVAAVPVALVKVKFWNVEAPPMASVPVAVKLASETLPEKRPLPCTESAWLGDVVPMPKNPRPVSRATSVRVPDTSVEKASEEEPVLKLRSRRPVMAPVVVPKVEAVSFDLKSRREPVEVAEVALRSEMMSEVPNVTLAASSRYCGLVVPAPMLPLVVKVPLLDVVALPPTQKLEATVKLVADAWVVEKRERPVMFWLLPTMLPPKV